MKYIKTLAIFLGISALLFGFFPSNLELGNIKIADFSTLLIFGGAFIAFWGAASFINGLVEGFFPNFSKQKPSSVKGQRSNTTSQIGRNMVIGGAITLGCSLAGLVVLGLIISSDAVHANEHIESIASRLLYVVLVVSVVLMFLGRWVGVVANFGKKFR